MFVKMSTISLILSFNISLILTFFLLSKMLSKINILTFVGFFMKLIINLLLL